MEEPPPPPKAAGSQRRRSLAATFLPSSSNDITQSRRSSASDESRTSVRRRAMPTQAGSQDLRRDVGDSANWEDDTLAVIVSGLWKYHKLLPPAGMSSNKLKWDMLVVLLVMINCYVIPVDLCFNSWQDIIDSTTGGQVWRGIDYFIDFLFLVDIIINFRTTYFDRDGELVFEHKMIARQYVWKPPYWFWMDLAGTVPFDLILSPFVDPEDAGAIQAAKMLKLPRLLRLSRLMKNLDTLSAGNIVRSIRLLIYFFLVAHWLACLWWLFGEAEFNTVSSFGTSWTFRGLSIDSCPPLDTDAPFSDTYELRAEQALTSRMGVAPGYANSTTAERRSLEVLRINYMHAWCDPSPWDPHSELRPNPAMLYNGDWVQQYLSALYWALTMVMKSAYIGPDTAPEKLLASIMVIFGSVRLRLLPSLTPRTRTHCVTHTSPLPSCSRSSSTLSSSPPSSPCLPPTRKRPPYTVIT